MATVTCDALISMGIDKNCADPFVQGVERKAYIFNRADIEMAALEWMEDQPNVITNLPLKSGKVGYTIKQYGTTPYTGSSTVLTPTTQGGRATNNISFIVPDNSPAVAAGILDAFLDGEFVIVLENKAKNLKDADNPGISAYQVFGLMQGLTLAESTRELYSDEALGGWPISLTETNVPKAAVFLYAESLVATTSLLEATLTAQSA